MNRMIISAILAGVLIAAMLAAVMPLERATSIHPRTFTGASIAADSITTTQIQDGTIANADISTTADIVGTKLLADTINADRLADTIALDAATAITTSGTSTLTLGGTGATAFGRFIAAELAYVHGAFTAGAENCATSALTGVAAGDIAVAAPDFDMTDGVTISRVAPGTAVVEICLIHRDATSIANPADGNYNVFVLDLTP